MTLSAPFTNFANSWPVVTQAQHWPIWNPYMELSNEVNDWLDMNVADEAFGYHEMFGLLGFANEVDAVHFKLQWR